ncbi:MAG TPA: D-alanyl-D-alanine carboxypeptidase family protein [Syntrophales bacterium]|nr:D-alanyl-D-alanine carboxypeptidase family protein [Syntrophales bacterium]
MNLKRFILYLCLLVVTFFFSYSDISAAPYGKLRAKAVILMDIESGKILYAKNPNKPMQPASLTKILSLYLVYEAVNEGRIHLTDKVKISTDAQLTGGSSMYLVDETEVALEDLIKGMAVVSANDASIAIAEHIGGSVSGFVNMMNAKAKELGMRHSHFINPTGLPAEGQVTTARDILILSHAYIRKFPEALQLHSMQEYTYRNITQYNNNTLLKQHGDVDGLKTGFVRASGFHLVATAKRRDTRLIAVVMGEKNPEIRERETIKLLERGFKMTSARGKASLSSKSSS